MNKFIISIPFLIFCASCSSLSENTSIHIAYSPKPTYKGFHVYRIEINDKSIIPNQSISLSKKESKKVKVKLFIGNGFSSPAFVRGSLISGIKTPSGLIIGMHPLGKGQLTYTQLMPAPIMEDGKKYFCCCRTYILTQEFDFSDQETDNEGQPFTKYILSIRLRYYILNQGDDEERMEEFEIPFEIIIKDTEPKEATDSGTPSQ